MPSLFIRSQDQNPGISVHLLEYTENGVGVTDKIYMGHDPVRVARNLDHRQGRSLSTRPMRRCFLYTVIAVLACLGLLQIFSWVLQLVEARADLPHAPCWCGDSDDDAIAMGCRYDHIAVDWLQPDCIDDDLVQEFDRSGSRQDGSWPYFEAEYDNLTSRYSFIPLDPSDIDVFAREGKEYFTTREWHVSHCLFTWKKQFRALSNGKSIESWNNNEEHIKHCSDYILKAMRSGSRLDDIETLILGVDRHKDLVKD